MLAVALSGPEISNDHHPTYAIVAEGLDANSRILRTQTFFYDVAGIEGLEPPILVLMAVITVATFSLPGFLVVALLGATFRAAWTRSR